MGRHTWAGYKGGTRTCRACGETREPPKREVGGETLYGMDSQHMLELMARHLEEIQTRANPSGERP